MKTTSFILAGAICLMAACNQEPEVPETYLLSTDASIDNSEDLKRIMSDIDAYNQNVESLVKSDSIINFQSPDAKNYATLEVQKVVLKTEIEKLFDPDNNFCELPKKVKNNLNKLKEDGKSWAPEYVTKYVSSLPDTAFYIPGTSISVLLHYIMIKSGDGQIRDYTLFGAPTFKNLDVERFILKEGFNSFFYSLDCSGYLNAAIEASGAIPAADIKTSAKMALERKKSLFLAGGVIVSPVAAAYYGDIMGANLDTSERIQILSMLKSIPDITDSDSIVVMFGYQALWMSDQGSSGFNGEANFGGNANIGVGVASISSSLNSGLTLSKKSSFSSYKTYFTNKKFISDLKPFTIADVKARLLTLQ